VEQGEPAAIAVLSEQLAALRSESVDTRLAWESALMYAFLADEAPPPGLLFEADLRLGWSENGYDLARTFGEQAAQRLHQLLDLAHLYVYASRFSPNRWDARLFASSLPSWVGLVPWMRSASRTFARWVHLCELAGARHLASLVNPVTLRRLNGRSVQSTDLLLALFVCWATAVLELVPTGAKGPAQVWIFYAALFVLWSLLPVMARHIKALPLARHIREHAKPLGSMRAGVLGIVVGVALIGSTIAVDPIHPLWVRAIGWTFVGMLGVPFVTLLATAAWYCLNVLERVAFTPFEWFQDLWGRHRFERFKQRSFRDEKVSAGFCADLATFPSALSKRLGRGGRAIFRGLRAGSGLAAPLTLLCGFAAWVVYYLVTIRPWFMREVLKVDRLSFGLLELLHLIPIIIVPLIAIGMMIKVAEALGLRRPT
jgi:hypothetical protein